MTQIAALPGVSVEERLNGRPSFPMGALVAGENLECFIKILEDAVDRMVESHKRSSGSSTSALPMQAGETASEGETPGYQRDEKGPRAMSGTS
jgi:hypothetical protein